MRSNGKVIRRKCKGHTALAFSVVRNYRDRFGRPRHDTLYNFGTIRSTEILQKSLAFWASVDETLETLVGEGLVHRADAKRIKEAFARYIPRRIAPAT